MNLRHLLTITVARSSADVEDVEAINKEFHMLHEEDVFSLLNDARAYRAMEPAPEAMPQQPISNRGASHDEDDGA